MRANVGVMRSSRKVGYRQRVTTKDIKGLKREIAIREERIRMEKQIIRDIKKEFKYELKK